MDGGKEGGKAWNDGRRNLNVPEADDVRVGKFPHEANLAENALCVDFVVEGLLNLPPIQHQVGTSKG